MIFYLLIAALSFLMLYFAVKKFTLNIDEKSLLEPVKVSVYPEFCDLINEKIVAFKKQAQSFENVLLDNETKNECLEKLGDLSRKLIFIQTMNLSKKNDQIWQNELFGFLKELEAVVISHFKDGEKKADELREDLLAEFKKLQEKA
ncbi:hypothetical protein [Campylobacter troglodytis]|uniref:hypothetical protein n=1 Tax=Campylobacter troglodytis TaxID=654363 RepID=UPI00115C232E|nr:hypothetical protein [Campylobacter troglodytis]TQR60642.1 hypothetical protein DMC01_04760 [Campylobacter troglodytis]